MKPAVLVTSVATTMVILLAPIAVRPVEPDRITPAHEQLAQEYVDLTIGPEMIEATTTAMVDTAFITVRGAVETKLGKALSGLDQGKLRAATERALSTVFPPETWKRDVYVPLVIQYFTEDDLRGVIAFYRTSVGRKMLRLVGPMMADANVVVQRLVAKRDAEFVDRFDREFKKQLPHLASVLE